MNCWSHQPERLFWFLEDFLRRSYMDLFALREVQSSRKGTRDVDYLKRGLEELAQKLDLIGDARGERLMLGLELVKDRETKKPAREEAALAIELMNEEGILVGKTGAFNNALRLGPPLTLSKQAKRVLLALEKIFQKLK